jgi:hypothetical protein
MAQVLGAGAAGGTRSGGYEMAPLDAQGREPAQQSNNLSALERGGGGGGGGGDGVDDERPGDVPSVLKRKAKASFGAINLPQAMCGFICGVILTLIIAALARSPIDQSAPPSLCEPAGALACERALAVLVLTVLRAPFCRSCHQRWTRSRALTEARRVDRRSFVHQKKFLSS